MSLHCCIHNFTLTNFLHSFLFHRKHKFIIVSEVGEIPYDHLLLTCGLQYQLPTRLVPRPARPFCDRRPLHPPAQLPESPDNVFRINSQYDAERALQYVKQYCLQRRGEGWGRGNAEGRRGVQRMGYVMTLGEKWDE